jgi:hypothetical protein
MHSNEPAKNVPKTTFAEAMSIAPVGPSQGKGVATAVGTFKLELLLNGVTLGFLGQDSNGWAVLVKDQSQALSLEWYPYNSVNYIRIAGSSNYMSVGTTAGHNGYVGFYGWWGAAGWTVNGGNLISSVNGQKMSIYSPDNGYIYCWNDYTVLTVQFAQ